MEATPVAEVTDDAHLVMYWRGEKIVDLERAFLDTNGAHQETEVLVDIPNKEGNVLEREEKAPADTKAAWLSMLADLNTCSQKGLVEMFDGSIGAGSVFMPYGGKYQLTETQAMVAKVPVMNGKTDTVTMMSYGFDPYVSSWSPYHGAVYAVVESIARIVANGGDYSKIRFTFQEYFQRFFRPAQFSQAERVSPACPFPVLLPTTLPNLLIQWQGFFVLLVFSKFFGFCANHLKINCLCQIALSFMIQTPLSPACYRSTCYWYCVYGINLTHNQPPRRSNDGVEDTVWTRQSPPLFHHSN